MSGTTPLRGVGGWLLSGLLDAADRRKVLTDTDGQVRLRHWQERRRRQQAAVRQAMTARASGLWGAGVLAAGSLYTAAAWSPWGLAVGGVGMAGSAVAARLAWSTTIPDGPDPDELPPAWFPTVSRASAAYPLLSRAVVARAVTVGVVVDEGPLAGVVGRATSEGERLVAGLARQVLAIEEHRARVGWSPVVDDALGRSLAELERGVCAFESLASAAAQEVREERIIDPLGDFEARVEGVRAAARTIAP